MSFLRKQESNHLNLHGIRCCEYFFRLESSMNNIVRYAIAASR